MPDVREELEVLAERRPRNHRPVVAERVEPAAHVLPRRVGHRGIAPAAVAHDLGRHALADRALGGGVREQRSRCGCAGRRTRGRRPSPTRRRPARRRPSRRAGRPRRSGRPGSRRLRGRVGSRCRRRPSRRGSGRRARPSHLVSLAPPTCGPSRGSRMSRRPSPRKLKPMTTITIASPGKIESHGDLEVRAGARQHASPRRLRRLCRGRGS